jgi:hypothetical protein
MSISTNTIIAFLLSDQGLALLAWIGTALAGWVGKQVHSKWAADAMQARVWLLAQGAVANTFDALVRTWKTQAGDGRLDEEQRKAAFDRTMAIVLESAKAAGIDAAKQLGPDVLRAMIERAITISKPGNALPVAPVAVQALFPKVAK